jgi:hypothetical protein
MLPYFAADVTFQRGKETGAKFPHRNRSRQAVCDGPNPAAYRLH